jgi:hypothetical protein
LKISFLSFQWNSGKKGKIGVDILCVWPVLHLKFPSYLFTSNCFLCV